MSTSATASLPQKGIGSFPALRLTFQTDGFGISARPVAIVKLISPLASCGFAPVHEPA